MKSCPSRSGSGLRRGVPRPLCIQDGQAAAAEHVSPRSESRLDVDTRSEALAGTGTPSACHRSIRSVKTTCRSRPRSNPRRWRTPAAGEEALGVDQEDDGALLSSTSPASTSSATNAVARLQLLQRRRATAATTTVAPRRAAGRRTPRAAATRRSAPATAAHHHPAAARHSGSCDERQLRARTRIGRRARCARQRGGSSVAGGARWQTPSC